jgi:hypothetical protein
MPDNIEKNVLKRIQSTGRGSVFIPNQFTSLGGRAAIDKALSRLMAKGTLRRLARGVYCYPKTHPLLGELTPPTESIVKALAGRDQTRLQPTGAYAANMLGLSEQVPARIVYLTDGPSRKVRIGAMTIELRQTTHRHMATAGRLSGLLIQALRHLGKVHVTSQTIARLKRTVPAKERQALLRDLKLAPVWMRPFLRELAEADG